MRANLLRWQWEGYPQFHVTKLNLWMHIFAVPAFLACTISFVALLVMMQWFAAAGAFVGMVVSFLIQGIGHKREPKPPIPFNGPGDVVTRIFAEQFVTFPRFVLSGGFLRAARAAGTSQEAPRTTV